jgi:hypothetical protein
MQRFVPVKHVLLKPKVVTTLGAARGIDTVREMARRCGIEYSLVYKTLQVDDGAETKAVLPRYVLAFAKALDVPPSQLLDESEVDIGVAMDAAVADEVAS